MYPCGDTVPGLNEQLKQAMQSIAYEKEKGDSDGSRTGMRGGYSTISRKSNFVKQ